MTKRVQWAKILGLKGVKIYKDKTAWGFYIKACVSSTKRQVDKMVKKLRAEGYNASYHLHIKDDYFGGAWIAVHTDDLSVARAKLTDEQYALIKADILANKISRYPGK